MTVNLGVRTAKGTTRRCDASCHHARGEVCGCICAGRFHGEGDPDVTWEELDAIRAEVELGQAESVQMRLGA